MKVYIVRGEGVRDSLWNPQPFATSPSYSTSPEEVVSPATGRPQIRFFPASTELLTSQPASSPPIIPRAPQISLPLPKTRPRPPAAKSIPTMRPPASVDPSTNPHASAGVAASSREKAANPSVVPSSTAHAIPNHVVGTGNRPTLPVLRRCLPPRNRRFRTPPTAMIAIPVISPIPTSSPPKPSTVSPDPLVEADRVSDPVSTQPQQQMQPKPSTLSRWNTIAAGSTSKNAAQTLPSPTTSAPPVAAQPTSPRARLKPWQKKTAQRDYAPPVEVQREALDAIVASTKAKQRKVASALPRLAPLAPLVARQKQTPHHPEHTKIVQQADVANAVRLQDDQPPKLVLGPKKPQLTTPEPQAKAAPPTKLVPPTKLTPPPKSAPLMNQKTTAEQRPMTDHVQSAKQGKPFQSKTPPTHAQLAASRSVEKFAPGSKPSLPATKAVSPAEPSKPLPAAPQPPRTPSAHRTHPTDTSQPLRNVKTSQKVSSMGLSKSGISAAPSVTRTEPIRSRFSPLLRKARQEASPPLRKDVSVEPPRTAAAQAAKLTSREDRVAVSLDASEPSSLMRSPEASSKASAQARSERRISADQKRTISAVAARSSVASRSVPVNKATPDSVRDSTAYVRRRSDDEIGTHARPIVAKADQERARSKRMAAATTSAPSKETSRQRPLPPSEKGVPANKKRSSELTRGRISGVEPSPTGERHQQRKDAPNPETSAGFHSMKSVVTQVYRVVDIYARTEGISTREEMRNEKKKILRLIQSGLQDKPAKKVIDLDKHDTPRRSVEAEARIVRQKREREKLLKVNISDIRGTVRLFQAWKKDILEQDKYLSEVVENAECLRTYQLALDSSHPDTVSFPKADIMEFLWQLNEVGFTISAVKRGLVRVAKEIKVGKERGTDVKDQETEFKALFISLRYILGWIGFITDLLVQVWTEVETSKREKAEFQIGLKGFMNMNISKGNSKGEETSTGGFVAAVKSLKPNAFQMVGEENLPMQDDLAAFKESVQLSLKKLATISRWAVQSHSEEEAASNQKQSREAGTQSHSSTPIPRKPRETKSDERYPVQPSVSAPVGVNQGALAAETGGAQKTPGDSAGRTKVLKPSSPYATIQRAPSDPKSLPTIPRRRMDSEQDDRSSTAKSQPLKPSGAGGAPVRRLNQDPFRLEEYLVPSRTAESARDKGRAGVPNASSKRGAADVFDGSHNSPHAHSFQPKPKRKKVTFANELVQGYQATKETREGLNSLFYDGYDLLGKYNLVQLDAVEERSQQMSRGAVISLFGFLRQYLTELKDEMDRKAPRRSSWIRMPYTPALQRDFLRRMKQLKGPPTEPSSAGDRQARVTEPGDSRSR